MVAHVCLPLTSKRFRFVYMDVRKRGALAFIIYYCEFNTSTKVMYKGYRPNSPITAAFDYFTDLRTIYQNR